MAKSVFKVIDKDLGFKRIRKEIDKLGKRPFVKTGIQGADADKKKRTDDGYDDVLTLLDVATINEYGGVRDGVSNRPPERSFLRATIDNNRDKYFLMVEAFRDQILLGKTTVEKSLKILGLQIESDVKAYIKSGISPENAPSTIAAKGSSTPLVDTGQLINSIRSIIDMGGKK